MKAFTVFNYKVKSPLTVTKRFALRICDKLGTNTMQHFGTCDIILKSQDFFLPLKERRCHRTIVSLFPYAQQSLNYTIKVSSFPHKNTIY